MDRLTRLLREVDEKYEFEMTHLANIVYYTLKQTVPFPIVRQLIASYCPDLLKFVLDKLHILRYCPFTNRSFHLDGIALKVRTHWNDDVHYIHCVYSRRHSKWMLTDHIKPNGIHVRKMILLFDIREFILNLQSRLSSILSVRYAYAFQRRSLRSTNTLRDWNAALMTSFREVKIDVSDVSTMFWDTIRVTCNLVSHHEEAKWKPPSIFEIFPELRTMKFNLEQIGKQRL